jgi:S-formylglutathione hydrolase FrmB
MHRLGIALALAAVSLGAWPSGSRFAGGGASGGVLAQRAKTFTNTIGVVDPQGTPASTIGAAMAAMGMTIARTIMPNSGDSGGNYNALAAQGIRFDFLWANGFSSFPLTSCANNPSSIATVIAFENTFIGSFPGQLVANEGPNETNNFPVCYNNTATATGSTGSVVNFTSTPAEVVTVAGYTYTNGGTISAGSGITVTDTTHPSAIPANTTIVSATSSTVTLSASVTVTNGDTIQFQAQGAVPGTTVASTASSLAWQVLIYNATQANLSGVKVANYTSFVSGASPQPPSIAGTADYNNLHFYPIPGGAQPTTYAGSSIISYLNPATAALPGKPYVVTETGWCTGTGTTGLVNMTTQANLLLNNYLDMFSANVQYTTAYTIFDVTTGDNSCFDNYGLYQSDQTSAKTSGAVIANMQTILADSATGFTPTRLNYSISGLPAPGAGGGFSTLLEKTNGNFEILIWKEPAIWNDSTHAPITPSNSSITVAFGLTADTVNVYDPMAGTAPISTSSSVASISTTIGAHPLIVEVIPSTVTYTVTPPPYMANVTSSPSLPFTVKRNTGVFSGSETVTIADGGAGGTITPSVGSPGTSTVTVTPTISTTSFTFTYKNATAGAKTLTITNAQSWTNPTPFTYTVATPIAPYDGTVWSTPGGCCNGDTGVSHHTYHSNLLNVDVGYVIYTPPGYPTGGPFPVLYIFPGSGSNENGYVGFNSPDLFQIAQTDILASTIKPMIIVEVNNGLSGDSRNAQPGSPNYGTWAPQNMFISEAIPAIDAAYSTIANKTGRALFGFSMGGQACMRFATKYPQMFSSAYCGAPASDDVAPNYPFCSSSGPCVSPTSSEPTQLSVLFNNSLVAWQNDTVWAAGSYNAPNINGLPIHVLIGSADSLEGVATDFYNLLDYAGVTHDALQVAPGCGHDYPCDFAFAGTDAQLKFASTHFP